VANALASYYTGSYPVITGQDCDIANVKMILDGTQSMSVFKDTRVLADQTAYMASQILSGQTPDINDTVTYNNGNKVVPAYLCEAIVVDANNYSDILIDSGYYLETDLGL
jgi:putative multiple sugar transport system substrate-binding protein